MNSKIHEQIRNILDSAQDLMTKSILEVAKHLRMVLPQLSQYSDQELEEMIEISMNYEEENMDSFGLADAIGWIKSNFDKQRYGGGCILRGEPKLPQNDPIKYRFEPVEGEKPNENHSFFKEPSITIQLCFLDKQGEPLLAANERHKVIHCKKIDPDLERQFGNNDMIILK